MENKTEGTRLRPDYYKASSGKQVWDFIQEMGLDFFQGNVLKYMYRYKGKSGLEDLKKAKTYLEKMINIVSSEEDLKKSPGVEVRTTHGSNGVYPPIEFKIIDNTKKPAPYESNGQYWMDRHSKYMNIPYSDFRLAFLRAWDVAESASREGVDFKDALLHQMSGTLGFGFQRDEKVGDS